MYLPSALFRKASAYCAREYDRWYILSAKYGLISPDMIIQPYDQTLKTMSKAERRAWGRKVSLQLRELGDHEYFAHAGRDYLEPLSGVNIVNLLRGLRIGERLRWYDEQPGGVGEMAPSTSVTHGASELETDLSVERLALAARWYTEHTNFNDSYMGLLSIGSFLNKLQTSPDEVTPEEVLNELITGFLNRWGCRLPKTLETAMAIKSNLVRGADAVLALSHDNLLEVDLSNARTAKSDLIAETYDKLRTVRRVGPTTASKILHVLNPALFVMWDTAIRKHYSALLGKKLSGGEDYVAFLGHMQKLGQSVARDLSSQQVFTENVETRLSRQLGYDPPLTLAKLLDEYNWVTIVKRVHIP
jgi:hypothetical protein